MVLTKQISKPNPALLNLINQLNNYANEKIKIIKICWTVNIKIFNIYKKNYSH